MKTDKEKLTAVIQAFGPMMKYVVDISTFFDGQLRVQFEFPARMFVSENHPDTYREFFSECWSLDISDVELQEYGTGSKPIISVQQPLMKFGGVLIDSDMSFWFVQLYRYYKSNARAESPLQPIAKLIDNIMAGEEASNKLRRG